MSETAKPDEMVRLARMENSEKAHIVRQALEDDGIIAQVLGDNLEVGFGDLPSVGAELWVRGADLEKAREFIAKHEHSHSDSDE